jgi:GT2 family glycosyltransferase
MMFRRELRDRLGGWDEAYDGYWVDADWCKRAGQAGRVVCVPAARVVHVEQNRAGTKRDRARIVQFHTGAYRFYMKHYTAGRLDPRAVGTAALLATRAAVLIAVNSLRSAPPPPVALQPRPSSHE